MNVSLLVLGLVFVLIAARKLGRVPLRIWQVMSGGALLVLLTGQISPLAALQAIDLHVMLFLFGMFVVGQALVDSGYLFTLSYRLLERVGSADALVLAILFGAGLGSALLMNDTLAIVGTPLMLRLAREHRLEPRLLLLSLAFAITTGSVMSPIGNPQNLLIAVGGGVESPFVTFLGHLAVPTLLNLLLAYAVLRLMLRGSFHGSPLVHARQTTSDPRLAALARWALAIALVLVLAKVLAVATGLGLDFPLSVIALAAAAPVLALSEQRWRVLRHIDWHTLVFFAAMFVLMQSVWNAGVIQDWLQGLDLDLTGIPAIFGVGVLLSQLISNVPLVALYLPLLQQAGAGTEGLVALAAASTIAGNLLILGAASNVIIIESAQRRGSSLGFFAFARVGIPLTLLQVAVYWAFLG